MKIIKRKNKFYDTYRYGQPEIRVFHKKATGNKSPRYLLKCGCCNEKVEIYYDEIPLAGLVQLREAEDYTVLKNFPYLFGLHIDYSAFDDLNLLYGMTDLEKLTFVETKVSDVSPIANLTKLKTLKLEGCPIEDLSPLKDIYPNLEEKDFELK